MIPKNSINYTEKSVITSVTSKVELADHPQKGPKNYPLTMKYSTSSQKFSSSPKLGASVRCSASVSSLSFYLAFIVLLSPDSSFYQLMGMGNQISASSSLFVAGESASSATSSEANNPVECTPLGEMIASRFNRAPESSLRMLRAGGHRRAIESLIKTHNNCMLMTDRVRFKKSGPVKTAGSSPVWSAYKVRGSSAAFPAGQHRTVAVQQPATATAGALIGDGSGYQLETLSPRNIDRLMAIFGWRRIEQQPSAAASSSSSSPNRASSATLDGGLYSVKLQPSTTVLRSGYNDALKPLMLLAPASEAAAAEEVGEQ